MESQAVQYDLLVEKVWIRSHLFIQAAQRDIRS